VRIKQRARFPYRRWFAGLKKKNYEKSVMYITFEKLEGKKRFSQ